MKPVFLTARQLAGTQAAAFLLATLLAAGLGATSFSREGPSLGLSLGDSLTVVPLVPMMAWPVLVALALWGVAHVTDTINVLTTVSLWVTGIAFIVGLYFWSQTGSVPTDAPGAETLLLLSPHLGRLSRVVFGASVSSVALSLAAGVAGVRSLR